MYQLAQTLPIPLGLLYYSTIYLGATDKLTSCQTSEHQPRLHECDKWRIAFRRFNFLAHRIHVNGANALGGRVALMRQTGVTACKRERIALRIMSTNQ